MDALTAAQMLSQEARALLTRLQRIRPFAEQITMVPAAAITAEAQTAVESYLAQGRRSVAEAVSGYLRWLDGPSGQQATPAQMQWRWVLLRLRFNVVLAHFDMFSSALTQRSEHGTGVWLAGLDAVAADAMRLDRPYFQVPPVICYLDRNMGAAIRRARTRLPGGGENPVTIVRVPRERMVGHGIASSLVHEVGHQGAVLLDLLPSLRLVLREMARQGGPERLAWTLWARWISEAAADFWSVAMLGIASTLGLMSVVSMPRAFVFRLNPEDPHPVPYLRVKLSCAMGEALYPHPQWRKTALLWESLYPIEGIGPRLRYLLGLLEASLPGFVGLLVHHRPPALGGQALSDVMPIRSRQPAQLGRLYQAWRRAPALMRRARPSLVFAVLGQARADGHLSPEEEGRLLAAQLSAWGLQSALDSSARCARQAIAPFA